MGAVTFRSRAARRAHGGVWCLGEWRARARHGASPSRHLRCGLLRVAGRRLPTACRDAQFASARVPRRRHAGAVLSRERDPLGRRAARRRCGRCHDRAGRVARRRVLERRVPADGGVGVWRLELGNRWPNALARASFRSGRRQRDVARPAPPGAVWDRGGRRNCARYGRVPRRSARWPELGRARVSHRPTGRRCQGRGRAAAGPGGERLSRRTLRATTNQSRA